MEKSDLVIPIIEKITENDRKMIESPFDASKLKSSSLPTTREIYELLYEEIRLSPIMLAKVENSRKRLLQTLAGIPESHNLMTHQWNTNVYAQENIHLRTNKLTEEKEMSAYDAQTMQRLTGIVSIFHDMIEEKVMTSTEIFDFLQSLGIPRYFTVKIGGEYSNTDLYRCIETSNETFATESIEKPVSDLIGEIDLSLCKEDDRNYLTKVSSLIQNVSDFGDMSAGIRRDICAQQNVPATHSITCGEITYAIDLSTNTVSYEKSNFSSIEQAKTIYVDEQTELEENSLAEAMILTAVLQGDKNDNASYLRSVHVYLLEHHPEILTRCNEQLCSIPGWREYYAEYIRSKVSEQRKLVRY